MKTIHLLVPLALSIPAGPVAAQTAVIDCIAPEQGLELGGTLVTVLGSSLDELTSVTIGGMPVENLEVLDPSRAIFNAPPGAVGSADVALTDTGGTTTLTDGFGYVPCVSAQGSALSFDGGDVVIFGAVDPLGPHTIEAWVRPDALDGFEVIVGHLNSPGAACAFGMDLNVNGNGLLGYAVDHSYNCGFATNATAPASAGVWTHLAGTYDGTVSRIYVNGQLAGEEQPPGSAPSAWMTAGGAQFFNGFQGLYTGAMDELRVWNHARSPQQIRDAMHRTLTGGEPGLVGYWRMDEGADQTVGDASSSGTHGVLGLSAGIESSDPTWIPSDAPVCLPVDTCPADTNDDGAVTVVDLLGVLAAWSASCADEDVNADTTVDILDLLAVLTAWGPAPALALRSGLSPHVRSATPAPE